MAVTIVLTDEEARLFAEFCRMEHHLDEDGFNPQEEAIIESAMGKVIGAIQ
jgi:hypothetical protein